MRSSLAFFALALACGTAPADSDGGPEGDGGTPIDSGVANDGGTPIDSGGPTDGGRVCDPTPGPMTGGGYCDLFALAIHTSPDSSPEARLYGRVSPDGLAEGGCAVLDEVEVLEGSTSIATLTGVGAWAPGDQNALLATGPAVPAMTARCAMEDRRFDGFGLLVRGRIDGGTFEAHCADAEGGSRWPPALVITCHDNVDERPFSTYANVQLSSMFTSTTIMVTVPHRMGGALTSVDGSIRVIPHAYTFGPPVGMPFDSSGWAGSISEATAPVTGPYSAVYLTMAGAAFDTDLCPPPMTGPPDPGFIPPPVMLVRFTGTGERGAYSTEAYVNQCNTLSM